MSEEFDLDGYLYKRAGSTKKNASTQKKWRLYYWNLIGGSLYYYKNAEDQEPKGTVQLSHMKFAKEQNTNKQFSFSLKDDKRDLLLAAEEESEFNEWVTAIEKNLKKDSRPPLKKEKRKSRAKELAFKAKKNMVGKVGTSAIGKKAIRSQAPEEVTNLVAALKRIIERESGSSKKASEIEDSIFKIGIKCYFLIQANKVTMSKLLTADEPLRQALEILAKCHDHAKFSRNPNAKLLAEKFAEVHSNLDSAAAILSKLVEPHLKPKNIQLIKDTMSYLSNSDRLMKIFNDESLDEDLQELINASEHYTQFHFYADEKD
jgi:hypothetical protein